MYEILKESFDFVGIINKTRYKDFEEHQILADVSSIFVVGLAYPSVYLKQKNNMLLGSIYTYGYDYHDVIKNIVDNVLKGFEYKVLVDNHEIDERSCLELTGLAYKAKNDLMINEELGSYFFIGLILTKKSYPEVIVKNYLSCGECRICIDACPVNALAKGFDINKCLSAQNQLKMPLEDIVIKKNYLLMGCDICQLVCPKNNIIKGSYHEDLKVKETTYVLTEDLFKLSNNEFKKKYGKHAYLWKNKTILLRNALTLLLKQKNTSYNDLIKETITSDKYPNWYKVDAAKILKMLESI